MMHVLSETWIWERRRTVLYECVCAPVSSCGSLWLLQMRMHLQDGHLTDSLSTPWGNQMLSGLSIIWALADSLESAQSIPIHPVQKSTNSSLLEKGPEEGSSPTWQKNTLGHWELSLSQDDCPSHKWHLLEVLSEIVAWLFQGLKEGSNVLQIKGRSKVADVGRRVAHSAESNALGEPGNLGWCKFFNIIFCIN